ncbi:hypothetical protein Droror1_Dr00027268, partial [Drosera rotundifolia]
VLVKVFDPPRPLHYVTTTTTNLSATRPQPSAGGVLPQQQLRRFTAVSIQLTVTKEAAAEAEVAESCQSRMTETTSVSIQWSFCQRDLIVLNFAAFAEITQGVRSSTRAVRVAKERIQDLTNINQA